jgi:tRNA threonylcarbamoyl adenosine modification protein YeaZ
MNLLAIDTALEACSVGVAAGGRPPVTFSELIGRGHAERLFPRVAAAMSEAGLAFADLDRIAVTVGPGSFTGLRVGIAAARGFALAAGRPAVGIGTLAVIAATARRLAGDVPVLALLDARRGEAYGQAFAADGSPLSPPEAAPPGHFAALLRPAMVLCGSGAALLQSDAPVAHRLAVPDIADLLALGRAAAAQSAPPRPLYLRPPDAKPQAHAAVARQ